MSQRVPSPEPRRIEALVRAYLAADYGWRAGDAWSPLRIGTRATALEARFPQARCFAVITAWDPQSIPRAEALNRAADAELQAALRDAGVDIVPACSASPDGQWREPGWLVCDLPVEALDALARRHGQLGTLCWPAGWAVRMRIGAICPPALVGCPDIDWYRE